MQLSKWQESSGLSNREAAAMLGVARNTYNRYAAGAQPMPLYFRLAVAALIKGVKPIPEVP